MSKEEKLTQKKIREREEQKYMQMTEEELREALFWSCPGSLEVMAIHKALKQYGGRATFYDRYPDVTDAITWNLPKVALIVSIVTLIIKII